MQDTFLFSPLPRAHAKPKLAVESKHKSKQEVKKETVWLFQQLGSIVKGSCGAKENRK